MLVVTSFSRSLKLFLHERFTLKNERMGKQNEKKAKKVIFLTCLSLRLPAADISESFDD